MRKKKVPRSPGRWYLCFEEYVSSSQNGQVKIHLKGAKNEEQAKRKAVRLMTEDSEPIFVKDSEWGNHHRIVFKENNFDFSVIYERGMYLERTEDGKITWGTYV